MTESNSIPAYLPYSLSLSPSIYSHLFLTILTHANYLNMDLDKPLDEMISSKKTQRPNNGGNNNAGSKPRQSRERRDAPYAVCPPCISSGTILMYSALHQDQQKISGYMMLSQDRVGGEVPLQLVLRDILQMSLGQVPLLPVFRQGLRSLDYITRLLLRI
jgi:hypothetical protein